MVITVLISILISFLFEILVFFSNDDLFQGFLNLKVGINRGKVLSKNCSLILLIV